MRSLLDTPLTTICAMHTTTSNADAARLCACLNHCAQGKSILRCSRFRMP